MELGLTQLRAGNALIDVVTVDSELGQLGGKPPVQNGRNIDHFCLQLAPFAKMKYWNICVRTALKPKSLRSATAHKGSVAHSYIHDPEGNVVELKPQVIDE